MYFIECQRVLTKDGKIYNLSEKYKKWRLIPVLFLFRLFLLLSESFTGLLNAPATTWALTTTVKSKWVRLQTLALFRIGGSTAVKMTVLQNDGGRMKGWLYLIRSNRIRLQYSRKRYSVLQDHLLKSFKSVLLSTDEAELFQPIKVDDCFWSLGMWCLAETKEGGKPAKEEKC
ncbi:Pleckstrin homology and lipid-binding START domains-containing protein [Perilla frutescens var. frutescens]|nr:Pleckstrin homology and lipid-binding START domains-containing protein [Perilla frutescens var. frutescens]